MKKIFIFTLSMGLSILIAVSAFAYDWDNHWAADYISSARNAGWADMREKNNFAPEELAKREEVFYMIYAAQLNSNTIIDPNLYQELDSFTDEKSIEAKYVKAFQVLYANNLISGYADNTLKPKANITRAEMAYIISSLISDNILSKNFYGYNDEMPEWAETAIIRCSRAGIISGYSDNTFRPLNYITRAEAVRMIQSLCEFNASINTPEQTTVKITVIETTETSTEATSETATELTSEKLSDESEENTDTDTHQNDMQKANELVQLINNKRSEEGVNTLTLDETLCDIAFLKAKDMYITNYDQKNSSTFGDIQVVLSNAGIRFLQAEILVTSKVTMPADVVTIFDNNSDDHDIYLQHGYNLAGVGVYEDRWAVIYVRSFGQ